MNIDQHSKDFVIKRDAIVRFWILGGSWVVFGLLHLLKRGEGFEAPVLSFAVAWAVVAFLNAGLLLATLRRQAPGWLFGAEKVLDLVWVAVFSALTGGSVSPFASLFFLAAFSAQVDLSASSARWIQAGAVVGCGAAELYSSGVSFADPQAWLLWSIVFVLVTIFSARVVAPYRKQAERYERLQALRREADELLRVGNDKAEFPDFLLERLTEVFGFQHGALLLYDEDSQELVLKASVHIPPDGRALLFRQNMGPNAQGGVGVYAARERRTTFLRDPASNPNLPPILRRIFDSAGSDRVALVPMTQGDTLIGVALLSSAGGAKRVENEEVSFLEFACSFIGGYLERWETKRKADSKVVKP
jgi:hypothetical protein